jgi:hypothetical protein
MSDKNIAQEKSSFAFGKINFKLMLLGLAIIVVGYLLMVGGGSDDPNIFNPEIFSFRRITLAPLVLIAGYGVIFYAILKKHEDA